MFVAAASVWVALSAFIAAPVGAPAPSHPISCLLKNGDRLTGRLTATTRTYVRIVNPVLGRVSIYKPDIAVCESDDPYVQRRVAEFLLPAPPTLRETPSIVLSPRPMRLVAARSFPSEALARKVVVVPLSQALPTSLATVGWKRKLNVSYALARGNANTADLGFVGGATRRAERSQVALTATRRFGKSEGDVASDFSQMTLRYDRALGYPDSAATSRPSYFSESTWERDPLSKLDRRVIENMGVSIPLATDPLNNMALEIGAGLTHEAFQDTTPRTRLGGLIRLAAKQKFGVASTDQQVSTYPDLAGPRVHYRFDTNLNLAAPLSRLVSLKFGFVNRYDTKPQAGVRKDDTVLQSGLGIEF